MKAVIYARYSSDNQREESIEGQIRECTAFADKNDITILRHYIREWRLDHFDYRDGISLDEKEATQLLINLRQSFGLKDSDLDVAQIQMPAVEQAFTAPAEQKPDIQAVLKEKGIAYIDKREHGGALWVVGGHELDDLMTELKGMGFKFWFSEKGGRVSKNQPAWFIAK